MDNYKPSLPDDTVNISKESPFKILATSLAGILIILLTVYVLSGLGAWALVRWMPYSWESSIGENLSPISITNEKFEEQRQELQRIVDFLVEDYIDELPKLTVHIAENEQVNAFAFPGGNIVVCSGLLEKVKDPKQLSMVLGHEIGHVKNRDVLRRLGRGLILAVAYNFLSLQSSVLDDFFSTTTQLGRLKFDRDEEYRADAFGLQLIAERYGDVAGAVEFYNHLKPDKQGMLSAEFLSTHPGHQNRISRLKKLIEERGYRLK